MRKIITFIIFLLLYLFAPQDARSQTLVVDNSIMHSFTLVVKSESGVEQRIRISEGVKVYDIKLRPTLFTSSNRITITLIDGNTKIYSGYIYFNRTKNTLDISTSKNALFIRG